MNPESGGAGSLDQDSVDERRKRMADLEAWRRVEKRVPKICWDSRAIPAFLIGLAIGSFYGFLVWRR